MIVACGPTLEGLVVALFWGLVVPLARLVGLVCAAVMLPPTLAAEWRDRRTAARVRRGVCTRCGYDLRATPRQCPECGLLVPPRPAWRARPPRTRAAGPPVLRPTVVCSYP